MKTLGFSVAARLGGVMAEKKNAFEFEKSLAELEALVTRMEGGDMTLDESLKAFERGVSLTRQCQEALTSAEQKVRLLMENNGRSEAMPFNTRDDAE